MDLPQPYLRLNLLIGLFSLPEELLQKFKSKSSLALLGRDHKDLNFYLPKSFVWFNRNQSREECMQELNDFFKEFKAGSNEWIIKRDGTSRGLGVHLLHDVETIQELQLRKDFGILHKKPGVAQKYIERPLLLPSNAFVSQAKTGYKWDFRIYGLIVGVNTDSPSYSCYLYEDGFARRCSEAYMPIQSLSGKECKENALKAHLTNTYINNRSDSSSINEMSKDMGTLQSKERNTGYEECQAGEEKAGRKGESDLPITMSMETLWEKLLESYPKDKVTCAKIEIERMLKILFQSILFESPEKTNADYAKQFQLLGIDVILDSDFKPWILEVNHFPDMRCYTMEQFEVKQRLLTDTIGLLFGRNAEKIVDSASMDAELLRLNSFRKGLSELPRTVAGEQQPSPTNAPTKFPNSSPTKEIASEGVMSPYKSKWKLIHDSSSLYKAGPREP
mmetsp:Transcript_5312/g.7037  ORF Transcript_5312/g.7037 Transcript_5312/m.7037 type:complete len:447 (+) Transcript_5312:203-1543(+)